MASNINSNNIDGTFPVAGVDNDSTGFRTNFTNIKTNFTTAAAEIGDIQSKAILKSGLSGTTLNNSMAGAPFSAAEIYDLRETEVDLGTASGSQVLNHASAHYHKITTSGSVSISFTNLPAAGKIGRIRLKLVVTNNTHTLTLPSAVIHGVDSLIGYSANIVSFATAGTYFFEFITDDQGTSIHVQDITRPRKFTANSATYNSSVANFDNYAYSNVSTGFSLTVTNRLLIDSSATLTSGTVNLPATAADGQTISVSTNNAITTLVLIPGGVDTIVGNVATLSAGSAVSYIYAATPAKWFRI